MTKYWKEFLIFAVLGLVTWAFATVQALSIDVGSQKVEIQNFHDAFAQNDKDHAEIKAQLSAFQSDVKKDLRDIQKEILDLQKQINIRTGAI